MIVFFLFFPLFSFADEAKYIPSHCVYAEVVSSELVSNNLYKTKLVEFGENRVFNVNATKQLQVGDEKFFLIGRTPFSIFSAQPTDMEIFEDRMRCLPFSHKVDVDYVKLAVDNCINSNIYCLLRYGFYRVQSNGRKVIFKNPMDRYIEVTVSKELEKPFYFANYYYYLIENISEVTGQVQVDYKPSKDPCFYLQIHGNLKQLQDFWTWFKCKLK